MATIVTDENYTATIVPEATINASLGERGPRGPKGDKGDPAFMDFMIDENGNLIYNATSNDYDFAINEDGELVVEF